MHSQQTPYTTKALEFLKKIGETNKKQPRISRHNFFTALSNLNLFILLTQTVNLCDRRYHPTEKWQFLQQFLHYYSSFIFVLKSTDTGKQYMIRNNFNIDTSLIEEWAQALLFLFEDSMTKKAFQCCTEKRMQSLFPELAIPVRLILNRLFDRDTRLFGYDFGCGLNFDLPLLASDYLPYGYRLPKNSIKKFNYPVNIDKAIGIDLQEPDIEWARVCSSPVIERDIPTYIRLRDSYPNRFVFQKGDILDFLPENPADFVITKRMRYQFLKKDQRKIKKSIFKSLRNGGYWITVGEEDYFKKQYSHYLWSENSEVWIYQKSGRGLIKIGNKPAIEYSQKNRQITDFDIDFFNTDR